MTLGNFGAVLNNDMYVLMVKLKEWNLKENISNTYQLVDHKIQV